MRQLREQAGPARGILRLPAKQGRHEHQRLLPRPDLRELVAHFWGVTWSVPTPQLVETLSHPTVHIVFEESAEGRRAEVAGIPRQKFSRVLSGSGRVFGIKLRPACFRAFHDAPAVRLTGQVVPLDEVLGPAASALAEAIFAAPSFERQVRVAEACLAERRVIVPRPLARLRDLVERVATDATLQRVGELARLMSVDARTLERRFRDAVGVSPKWVIRRYRLHEAALRLERGDLVTTVAHDLGYADQAHFARDFKTAVGMSPVAFAKRSRGRR